MSIKRLIILGSSAQVPTRERNHSGYFMHWNREGLLFDPGEGTQRQMCRFNVRASTITKIFITHFHGDHCLGLPGVIQRLALDNITHSVDIFFPASGMEFYDNLIRASSYHQGVKMNPHPVEDGGEIFVDPSMRIQAEALDHTIDAFGYKITESDSLTVIPEKLKRAGIFGADIGSLKSDGSIEIKGKKVSLEEVSIPKKGQSMAFIMDTRYCRNALNLAHEVDLLICESTYTSEHSELAKTYGHLTSAQAARIARLSNAGRLVLTHYSQRYLDTRGMLSEAKEEFSNCVVVADGDNIDLPVVKRVLE